MSSWTLDNKLYYANECGFYVGLGLSYLRRYDDATYWYYKKAAHYGRLALSELEVIKEEWNPEYMDKHYDK